MEAFDSVIEEAWKLESTVEQSHALEGESMLAEKLKHYESSMEASSSCQVATELKCHQRDIVAAHILVQMANEDSGLLRHRLNLHGLKHIMKGMPRMRWETEGDTIAGDSHSQVARRKATFFAKRQQPAFGGQINDADSVILALSAMPSPGRRKHRKMNSGVELSSLRPKYMKNDVSEDNDGDLYECGVSDGHEWTNRWGNDNQKPLKACHEDRHDRSGVLRIKKQKRVARSYLKREQNVDVAGTVNIPSLVNNIVSEKETENLHEARQFLDGHELTNRWGNNDQKSIEAGLEDRHDRFGMLRINKRKRAARSYIKRETEDVAVPVKIPLKRPFKLAVPTVQANFSFSIIHLLTAIRRAMVTRHAEGNAFLFGKDQGKSNELINGFDSLKIKGVTDSILTNPRGLPYLTLNRIVKHVRSNPIDPRILQTREPLQVLVRGVLKIFSSKKVPLGAEGWKPLTFYHKSRECWLWIGPFNYWDSSNLLSMTTPVNEEDMASEAWGLPHQMLVDLVDSFAIWFNSFQKRLHPIGSLLTPTLNKSKRFMGLKRKMNITTISPSSEEVRAHFQKEEALRHLVPDRGFCYTTQDGRKSAVAPLRKVNKIGRYHAILKADRPRHISTLSLLRDAADRLPGGMGTRADICTLMSDSQYLVEDVSDEQLHQAASQGLDRLQYEVDPCVKYNGKNTGIDSITSIPDVKLLFASSRFEIVSIYSIPDIKTHIPVFTEIEGRKTLRMVLPHLPI